MAKLVSYSESGSILAEYLLKQTVSVVGRIAEQDIFLQGNSVSRKHAEIHCAEDEYYVIDLSSLNGTFVNGDRVSKSQLLEGDLVTFGKINLTFSFEAVSNIEGPQNASFLSRFVTSIQQATTKVDGHGVGALYEFLAKKSEDTLKLEEDILVAQQARTEKMEQA